MKIHINNHDAAIKRRANHRGSIAVYLVLLMPVLFLVVSLAVDVGRAQTAKTQLQAAVDAATRAAAQELVNFRDNATAAARAKAVASGNRADGRSVVLDNDEIDFGTWDPATRTFTVDTPVTNAVRITAHLAAARGRGVPTFFAAMMGRDTVDVHATAIAYVTKELAPFNANGDVTFKTDGLSGTGSDWRTDSYIGHVSEYSSTTKRGNGHLLSNGAVKYEFTTPPDGGQGYANMISNTVEGTIYSANGADCTYTWNQPGNGAYWVQYGGWNNPGPSTLGIGSTTNFAVPEMPTGNTNPTIPVSYLSGSNPNGLSDLTIADGATVHLPAGTYTLNSISISNNSTVIFDGPVTLNVATNLSIDNAAMMPQVNDPKYLVIKLCNANTPGASANTMTFTNLTQNLYADINAPAADMTMTQGNNGNSILGRIYANNMTYNCIGNGGIHGDESLLMAFHMVQ